MSINNKQTIVIDKSIDLLKIPYSVINNSKLSYFSGIYFQKIYEEALRIEKGEDVHEQKSTIIQKTYPIELISFEINYPTNFGEEVGILGSIEPLGTWKDSKILFLSWNKGNVWTGSILFNQSYPEFEFKFIITDKRKIKKWESGVNRRFSFNTFQKDIAKLFKGDYYEYDEQKKTLKFINKWN